MNTGTGTPANVYCRNHPARAAIWACVPCEAYLCDLCVRPKTSEEGDVHYVCVKCGSLCVPVSSLVDEPRGKTFFEDLVSSLSYPLRGNGIFLLIAGTVFFWILDLLSAIPAGGIFFVLFAGCYFSACMLNIIASGADGKDEMPSWPDFTNFWDALILPFLAVLETFVASFLPLILCLYYYWIHYLMLMYSIISPDTEVVIGAPVYLFLGSLLFAAVYWPMGLIGAALDRPHIVWNPVLMITSMIKVLDHYTLVCISLFVVMCLSGYVQAMAVVHIPFIGSLLAGVISFYFMIVEMRMIGLVYYHNEQRLGWFA